MEFAVLLDTQILDALYALRDPIIVQGMIWVSELGSEMVVGGLALCLGLFFALKKRVAPLAGLAVSVLGSAGAVFFIKNLAQRARPDEMFQAYFETGFSLPSGHATMALAFYGFLAWLLWRTSSSRPQRVALLASAVVIIGLIGFSRLYLGVHFASDVLVGFAIAGLFVWTGIITTKRVERTQLSPEEPR